MAKKKLDENSLDGAAGGYIYDTGDCLGVVSDPHEVVDEDGVKRTVEDQVAGPGRYYLVNDDGDGSLLGVYRTKDKAIQMAKKKGQSQKELSDLELCILRNAPHDE